MAGGFDLGALYQRYLKWVGSNPSALGDVEMTAKWLSYFIAGKLNNSSVICELVYSLSNLLVFYNDRVIEKAHSGLSATGVENSNTVQRIKVILTTLEYCEVFIELSAHKVWGSSGRWFVIVVVQTFKCIGRLILTLFYRDNIVRNPPIPVLDRSKLKEQQQMHGAENVSFQQEPGHTVQLKRSGRVLRRVEGAPPIINRSFKPLAHESSYVTTTYGGRFIKTAELMYILKPLIHLASVRKFGEKSWKSYFIPMAIDIASVRLYYKNREYLSKEQKIELSKRCVSMLLYLMRSPFYDRYSKQKIACLLNGIGNNVPLTGTVTNMILSYIPLWQETYFYMWST